MYGYIVAVVGKRWADVVAALVYALLLIAVAFCLFEPQAEFEYLGL
jgi:hypothetical protein